MTAEYKEHSECCRTLYLLTNFWTLVGKLVSSNQGRINYTKLDQNPSVSLEISVICKVKSRKIPFESECWVYPHNLMEIQWPLEIYQVPLS